MGTKVKLKVWRGDAGQGELVDYEVEAESGRQGQQVDDRIRRTRNGRQDPDRVVERVHRKDPGWADVLLGDLHGALADVLGEPDPIGIDGGDSGRRARGDPQCLGDHRDALAVAQPRQPTPAAGR